MVIQIEINYNVIFMVRKINSDNNMYFRMEGNL